MSDAQAIAAAIAMEVAAELSGEAPSDFERIRTSRHDNPHLEHAREDRVNRSGKHAGNHYSGYGGRHARFALKPSTGPIDRSAAALPLRHPAVRDGRTMFLTRVFDAEARGHVLIDGVNNAKIGNEVTKGAWAGMPIFLLSLEERATCPRSCAVWRECYGNAMPFAVRIRYEPGLRPILERELLARAQRLRGRKGFVVRLHALGDFPDLDYVGWWRRWLMDIPQLRVFGYTAHRPDTPVGLRIAEINKQFPDRWAIKFSVPAEAPIAPMQAAVVWGAPLGRSVVNDVLACPQETGGTETCGQCGLCWSPEARNLRIAFMGHGRKRRE